MSKPLRGNDRKMDVNFLNNKLLEISPIGIVTMNRHGDIIYINRHAEQILGLSKKEVLGISFKSPKWKIKSFNNTPFPEEKLPFSQVKNTKKDVYDVELSIEGANGQLIYLSINASPILNDHDEFEGVTTTIEDVSSSVLSKRKLLESENRYKHLFENLIDEVHTWEVIRGKNGEIINWRLVDANQSALKTWGKSISEVKGKTATELFGEEAIQIFKPIVYEIFETGETKRWEHYFPPTDQFLWMESIPIGDYFISTGRDITAMKNAEKRLRELKEQAVKNKDRLKHTQSLARLGGWEYDVVKQQFLFDDNFYQIFNSSVDQVGDYTMTPEEYAKRFVHPDDRQMVGKEIAKGLQTDDPNFSSYLEHRMILEDGSIGYIGVKYFIEKDKEGKTIRQYGFNQDITERRQIEEDLIKAKDRAEENEDKLEQAQALAHIGSWEYVFETDKVSWSKELMEIFERPKELGAPAYSEQRPFYTQDSFEKMDRAVEACINKGIPFDIELDIITSKGRSRKITSKGDVTRDKTGKIIGCNGTSQDITLQSQQQELIKSIQHKLEFALETAKIGIYDWDLKTNKFEVFGAYYKVIGHKKSGFKADPYFKNIIIQDDLQKLDQQLINIKNDTNENLLIDFRIKDEGHRTRWVRNRAQIFGDKSSKHLIGLIEDVTHQYRHEQEILKATINGQEKERTRISAEMHDGVQQVLLGLLLTFRNCQNKLKTLDHIPPKLLDKLDSAMKMLSSGIDDTRAISHDLMPNTLAHKKIVALLEPLINSLKDNFNITFNSDLDQISLKEETNLALFRITQEALNNIIKYAKASDVVIDLSNDSTQLKLTIQDDGVGMNGKSTRNKFGINSMANRAKSLGGQFELISTKGNGTTVDVSIPLDENLA